jgi:hypothetical protein
MLLMGLRIKNPRVHRRVIFMAKESSQAASPSENLEELLSNNANTGQYNTLNTSSGVFEDAEEDSPTSEEGLLPPSGYKMQRPDDPLVPNLFASLPPLCDLLKTVSSTTQDLTVQECLPFLLGSEHPQQSSYDFNAHGVPNLDRKAHVAFLNGSLGELPSGFVSIDASRPWMLYWALAGLHLLGEDVSPYRERCVYILLRRMV